MRPAMVVEAWLRDAHPGLRDAGWDLARVVEETVPDAEARVKWGVPMWSVDGRDFCYLSRTKDRVSLGFQRGADLRDPRRLLSALGNARDARHVVVPLGSRVPEGVAALVAQAADLARSRGR